MHFRPAVGSVAQFQPSAVAVDDVIHDRQPEAGAIILGSVKRIQKPVYLCFWKART